MNGVCACVCVCYTRDMFLDFENFILCLGYIYTLNSSSHFLPTQLCILREKKPINYSLCYPYTLCKRIFNFIFIFILV